MSLSESTGWVASLSYGIYVVYFSGGAYSGSAGTVTYSISDRKVTLSNGPIRWGNPAPGASGTVALSNWARAGSFDLRLPFLGDANGRHSTVHAVGSWTCPG
jgi:hypothetical protein